MAMLATQAWWPGTIETWEARRDETRRLPPARGGLVVQVEAGEVVVTQAGHGEDFVLSAGQRVRLAGPGLAVAWALTAARVTIHGERRHGPEAPDSPERPLAA